jgi:hypothetical protein
MVSAYVNALQHPDPAVNTALQSIRDVMDGITIDGQGNGLAFDEIGRELLFDMSTRLQSISDRHRQGEFLQGLSRQQTADVMRHLEVAREQVREVVTRNAEQQVAQPQAQTPDIGNFIQTLRRTDGIQVAERVETVVFSAAENINPNREIRQFANALREAAANEENGLVDDRLNELADEFEAAAIRQDVNAMEPDAGQPANRQQGPSEYVQSIQPTINNLSNELFYMDISPEGVPNTLAISNTIFALRNGTVDHAAFRAMPEAERQNAMNAVADDIEGRAGLTTTEQQADLFRDVYSRPQNQDHVYISSDQAGLLVDDELSNVIRTYGEDVGERVGRVVEDILEHMSFEDDPHGVINRLRRHTARGASVAVRGNVEQGLLDIAQRLEESFAAAFEEREEQRMQPVLVPRVILNMSNDELARHLTPADIGQIDASFEAMMTDNEGFAADGVPTLPAAAMLTRRFNVYDLDNFSREALARRFEAEHRQRQQQQLVVQPAPEVAEPQQGRSIRELYEEFNDAIANAIEEGEFDPTNYSNADLAQFVLDDAMGGGLTDLTDVERQALADVVRQRGYDGNVDNLPAQQPNVADADIDDELIQYTMGPYIEAVEEIAEDSGRPEAVREIDRVIQDLRDGEDEIYAFWDGEGLTTAIRRALSDRLLALRREYRDEPPQGYAKGGAVMPVSKYMGNPTLAGLAYKYGGYVH